MAKVQFGLKSVYYAIVTETVSGGVTSSSYGTPKAWGGAVTLTLSPKGESNQFRADDTNYYTWGDSNGYEGSFESAHVPADVLTDVFGELRDDDDFLVESTSDTIKKIALMFEIGSDSTPTRYCFYNCLLSKPSIEAETTGEDGNEPKTVTCDITVSPRPDPDGYVKIAADETTDSTAYAGFFSSVPVPTFTPPTP